jgi:Arc/MetJ family transcription regulator
MRTTLDVPAELLEEARAALGFKSKTDTIVLALRELVRRQRLDDLKTLMGKVRLEVDVPASRRRVRPKRR